MAEGLLNKASIILTPTGYKAGTLYNVAPIDEPYEDFDFARASVASRVNSSGLVEMVGRTLSSELVTCGDFSCADPNDYWTIENTWTFGSGVANGNGANGSSEQLVQSNVTTIGKTYLVSYEILNYVSGSLFLPNVGSVKSGNGIHTEYITATQTDLKVTGINFNGSITNVSFKEIIDTNNIPRISYDSNGENGHILLEPTSTNLIPYSEDFSDSSWIKVGVTITSNNAVSPDGTTNASTVSFSAASQYLLYNKNMTTVIGESVSISIFADTNTSDFLSFGGATPSGTDVSNIETLNNGFYRHTLTRTFTVATTNTVQFIIWDASVGNYVIWGAQLEEQSYATSYIPTLTGSTVTRATETATGAGSATLINSTEGVLYAEIAALADDSTLKSISLSDSTTANRVIINYSNQSNRLTVDVRVGGIGQAFMQTFSYTITNLLKIALKYKQNDFALWINGTEVATDNSGSTFSTNTLNTLAFNNGADGEAFYGKCKALAVFDEALSDDELNNLTG